MNLRTKSTPITIAGLLLFFCFSLFATPDASAQRSPDNGDRNETPEERAHEMRERGESASDVAEALIRDHRVTTDDLARIFRQTGFAARETVPVLRGAARASLDETVRSLRSAGFEWREVGDGLRDHRVAPNEAFGALRSNRASARDAADVGKSSLMLVAIEVISNMTAAGYEQTESVVGAASADFGFGDLGSALHEMRSEANKAAGDLKEAGATAQEAAIALKEAGYAIVEIAEALMGQYGLAADGLALTLKGAGYSVILVAEASHAMGIGAQAIAEALLNAGYTYRQVAQALYEGVGIAVDEVAFLLHDAGAGLLVIADALSELGVSVATMLDPLRELCNYLRMQNPSACTPMIFTQGLLELGASWQQAVDMLLELNAEMSELGFALVENYGIAAVPLAIYLQAQGFGVKSIALALKGMNVSVAAMAQALHSAGFATAELISEGLHHAGIALEQAAGAMRQLGYGASVVASALQEIYGDPHGTIGLALQHAGYTAKQIATALYDGLAANAQQAWDVLIAIGTPPTEMMAELLKDAGYSATQVAEAFRDKANATALQVAQRLSDAGFSRDTIMPALANAFDMALDAVDTLLASAGL